MDAIETSSPFTIGVFQDVAWAQRGLDALIRAGLDPASLSIVAPESAETRALVSQALAGASVISLVLPEVGAAVAVGPLLAALQGDSADLERLGLSRAMRRVGFQAHDGRIYERLTARGGVLVAVHSEPRAADALALFLSYGGGNAAIGAWLGRL